MTEKDEYLKDLIYFAETMGISSDMILELLDEGYDYLDIEEMLYDTELLYGCYDLENNEI